MAGEDWFGISDEVRRLSAPPGYESVHLTGMSWAIGGRDYHDTTRIGETDWNAIIAQFRGLLTLDGIDLTGLEVGSPFVLKQALLAAAVSTQEAAFTDNAQAIADLLEPLLLTAGLPTRLGATGAYSANLDNSRSAGWYSADAASTNKPAGVSLVDVLVLAYSANRAIQIAFDVLLQGVVYFRGWKNTTGWSAWESVDFTRAQKDARYVQLAANNTLTGNLTVTGQLFAKNAANYFANAATGTVTVLFGYGRTVSGQSRIEFYGDHLTATTWGQAIFSTGGAAGELRIVNVKTGGIDIQPGSGTLRRDGNLIRDAGNTPDGSAAIAEAGTGTTMRAWSAADLKAGTLAHAKPFALIATISPAGESSFDVTDLGAYSEIAVEFVDIITSVTNDNTLGFTLSSDNGVSFLSSNYHGGAGDYAQALYATARHALSSYAHTREIIYARYTLRHFNEAKHTVADGIGAMVYSLHATAPYIASAAGAHRVATAMNAIRISVAAGNFGTQGSINIYGRK